MPMMPKLTPYTAVYGSVRSLRQYWVQSLSVHSEHCNTALEWSQKRSGYIITHSSQTSHAAADITTNETAKKPPIKINGENIIRWSQLKIRQVVQHRFFIIRRKGHQINTQIKSQT